VQAPSSFAVVQAPGSFEIGSPTDEKGRVPFLGEDHRRVQIDYSFAVGLNCRQLRRQFKCVHHFKRVSSAWPNDMAAGLSLGGLTLTSPSTLLQTFQARRIRRALLAHRGRRPAALA
jgi:hypothetical protein